DRIRGGRRRAPGRAQARRAEDSLTPSNFRRSEGYEGRPSAGTHARSRRTTALGGPEQALVLATAPGRRVPDHAARCALQSPCCTAACHAAAGVAIVADLVR